MKKKKFGRKVLILTFALLMLCTGAYAGTVISKYKTNRGDYATIEQEEVHKNRIALKVNGAQLSNQSWYANGVTYVPISEAAEMLGGEVVYTSSTQTAEINTTGHKQNQLIKKSDLPYTMKTSDNKFILTINSFKATTSGVTMNITATNNHENTGNISPFSWNIYANNDKVLVLGMDDYLTDNSQMATGKTVTGDVYYSGLPTQVDKVIAEFTLSNWGAGNSTKYTFELEV